MKIWRLVSGILSIVVFIIITFQSCAAGFINAVKDNKDDTSDSGGILVAFGLLVAGIVATTLWKNRSKGGDIALIILYGLTALMGFANQGIFRDLMVWSSWALICAIMAALALFLHSIENNNEEIEYTIPQTTNFVSNVAKKECPNCHAEIDADSAFCSSCGQKLQKKSFCKNCGNERLGTENICSKCGTPFDGVPTHSTNNITYYDDETNNSSNMKIILPIIIGVVLLALIGGGWYYWNLTQKANSLLTIETVIDLYQSNNMEHIRQVLKDNGYSLFWSDSENEAEYWSKNVQLKTETDDWYQTTYCVPIEKKGGMVCFYNISIDGNDEINIVVSVYADEDFKEWEKQLQEMGYKEVKYSDEYDADLPEEDGWTALGAHQNLCKLYKDNKGNSIEFMKDGDGKPGYDVFHVSIGENK